MNSRGAIEVSMHQSMANSEWAVAGELAKHVHVDQQLAENSQTWRFGLNLNPDSAAKEKCVVKVILLTHQSWRVGVRRLLKDRGAKLSKCLLEKCLSR